MFLVDMKQKTAVILFLIAVLIFSGCAGAKISKKASQDSGKLKTVYSTIRQLLEHGNTVCVMVHYKSSFDGLSDDEMSEDYGCEADPKIIVET